MWSWCSRSHTTIQIDGGVCVCVWVSQCSVSGIVHTSVDCTVRAHIWIERLLAASVWCARVHNNRMWLFAYVKCKRHFWIQFVVQTVDVRIEFEFSSRPDFSDIYFASSLGCVSDTNTNFHFLEIRLLDFRCKNCAKQNGGNSNFAKDFFVFVNSDFWLRRRHCRFYGFCDWVHSEFVAKNGLNEQKTWRPTQS